MIIKCYGTEYNTETVQNSVNNIVDKLNEDLPVFQFFINKVYYEKNITDPERLFNIGVIIGLATASGLVK